MTAEMSSERIAVRLPTRNNAIVWRRDWKVVLTERHHHTSVVKSGPSRTPVHFAESAS